MHSAFSAVKEVARGRDWVKFLTTFGGNASFEQVRDTHARWAPRPGEDPFGCGRAEVMKFNLDPGKCLFKFRTEPYSMKSNDCYRYIAGFGEWLASSGGGFPECRTGGPSVRAFSSRIRTV